MRSRAIIFKWTIMAREFQLNINGINHPVTAEPERSLLSVLRDELNLTGTKYGCGQSQCGACTVLIDSKAITSCITPVSSVEGKKIVTIEGFGSNGQLHACAAGAGVITADRGDFERIREYVFLEIIIPT